MMKSVWQHLDDWINTPDPGTGYCGRIATIDNIEVVLKRGIWRVIGYKCPSEADMAASRPHVVVAGTDEEPASLELVIHLCLRKWDELYGRLG